MKIKESMLRRTIRGMLLEIKASDPQPDEPDLTMYSETLNDMIISLLFRQDMITQIDSLPAETEVSTVLDTGELFSDYDTINEVHVGIAINDEGTGKVEAYYICDVDDRSKSNLAVVVDLPRSYQNVDGVKEWLEIELEDALSHELRHSCDPTEMLSADIPEGEEKWKTVENIYKHFGSEAEIRGNVAGIIGRARRSGEDPINIMNDYIDTIFNDAIAYGHSEEELVPVMNKIGQAWSDHLDSIAT